MPVITVPPGLAEHRIRQGGDGGRRWLGALPGLVEEFRSRWGLTLADGPAGYGANSLVIQATRSGQPCVLKLCWREDPPTNEVTALRAWNGTGAVMLLESSEAHGALLLERLDPGRSLAEPELFDAAAIAGELIRELAVPAPPGLRSLTADVEYIASSCGARQQQLGNPLPPRWVRQAVGLARDLGTDVGTTLIDTDLHYGNVLAGTRRPWLMIDPKACAGDPERSVAELMWTRIDDTGTDDDIRALLSVLVDAGKLDAEKALAWTVARAVDYWLWGLGVGLTEDPVRCHRLLAALT